MFPGHGICAQAKFLRTEVPRFHGEDCIQENTFV